MNETLEIIIIAAISENRVIGKDGGLPWHIPDDLRHFRELTDGCPCIMGRKTYESLPNRPLPNRENIVVSSQLREYGAGVRVFPSLEEAIGYCKDRGKVFVCGGGSLYNRAIALADTIELTLVHRTVEGDTWFPAIRPDRWRQTARTDREDFSFVTLRRETDLF
ncbi:MAG: dihydrofolate reductase [Spirochaetaceae bacterium]|jgi:dihydrofolate reductase|nr:dihydrofolate reductase [Spirochaetaceae bacterium]